MKTGKKLWLCCAAAMVTRIFCPVWAEADAAEDTEAGR